MSPLSQQESLVISIRKEVGYYEHIKLQNLINDYVQGGFVWPRPAASDTNNIDFREKQLFKLAGKMIFVSSDATIRTFNFVQRLQYNGSWGETNTNDGNTLVGKIENRLQNNPQHVDNAFYTLEAICTPNGEDIGGGTVEGLFTLGLSGENNLFEYAVQCNKPLKKLFSRKTRCCSW